jgi:hypothetical protein
VALRGDAPAGVWMLAVPTTASRRPPPRWPRRSRCKGAVVFHCSGAKASTELDALRRAGALVASVHPVRSFADPAAVAADFDGTFCGVEGDAAALALLLPRLRGDRRASGAHRCRPRRCITRPPCSLRTTW